MTDAEIRQLYLLAAGAARHAPSEIEAASWVWLLDDIDAAQATAMVRDYCRRHKWMPQPAEIIEAVRRLNGDIPPTVDEATGYYLADEWDRHPLVRRAADAVDWDHHHPDVADRARFSFRNAYAALLEQTEDDRLRPAREAITAGTGADLMQLLAGEAES
jgi:hypothetical protein